MNNSQFKLLIVLHAATLFLIGMLFIQTSMDNDSTRSKSFGDKNASSKSIDQSSEGIPLSSSQVPYEIDYSKNYVYGKENAPNELVVFSNHTCGFCKQFYNETFKELNEEYIKNGKLKVVFIFNGSPLNKIGALMAKSAEIARNYNKYEAIQDTFYSEYFELDSVQIVGQLLKLGIDEKELKKKLNNDELLGFVADQLSEGRKHQVRGAPIFFFNKKRLEGYLGKKDFLNFFNENYLK